MPTQSQIWVRTHASGPPLSTQKQVRSCRCQAGPAEKAARLRAETGTQARKNTKRHRATPVFCG